MARMNKCKPALWFSPHCPTEDQLKDIQRLGFELVSVEWGMRVGELELDSDEMVEQMLEWITNNVRPSGAKAIFGLPSTPIMGHFKCVADLAVKKGRFGKSIPFFAPWTIDGSQHKAWVHVGYLAFESNEIYE